jgi:hypothetical protein
LSCVRTFIEAVGQGCVRFGSLDGHAIDKMSSGSGSNGDDGLVEVVDSKLDCPAIVNKHDLPKASFGAAPPSQDGFAVKDNFATCFVEKYLAAHVAQDDNGEEIVDKTRESMS